MQTHGFDVVGILSTHVLNFLEVINTLQIFGAFLYVGIVADNFYRDECIEYLNFLFDIPSIHT